MADSELQKTLERLGTLLVKEIETWEQKTRSERHRVMDLVTQQLDQGLQTAIGHARAHRHDRRLERKKRRLEHRALKRQQQLESASIAGGVFSLVFAAVIIAFAILRPDLWWLIFVALGVGGGGAHQISLAAQRARLEKQQREQPPRAAAEIDTLCDQLLSDLKASPEAVRAFLQQPEKTVEALRSTSKALDARRRQLQTEDAQGRLERLAQQRAELSSRRDAADDPQARSKLDDALRSLASQESALRQLHAATERVDGEYTSLLVLLQELKTRVAVAKSTSSEVQLGGLKQSVGRLNVELEAITESLQAVRTEGLPLVSAVDEGAGGGLVGSERTGERG